MLRVARFVRSYLRQPIQGVSEEDVELPSGTGRLVGSLIRPKKRSMLPGWILLHGVTVPGRRHPVLTRFAHALASSGAVVLIPEVEAWRKLKLDPEAGVGSIEAAVQYFLSRPDVVGDLNLVGFSFGATHALIGAARDGIREHVRGVVGFGGYCDLGRTLRCMMTGEHEWLGIHRRLEPDPYGRWIAVGNYIDAVPEFAHMLELKQAALELATESGTRGVYAAEASYDDLKLELRERLPEEQREIWDVIAPPAGVVPPAEPGRALAAKLVGAALARDPHLEPRGALPRLTQKIVLAHGHDDRLIPFTETLRLREALPPGVNATVSITRLFAHSREAERLGYLAYPREVGRYFALLRRALDPA